MRQPSRYEVVVIGGGHAGAEAAWAAANMLRLRFDADPMEGRVALITMDAAKIGAMSCNPAIGGLAKGQMVREIDALGGLMGLAADATGIQFKVLNASKGAAVHGPRCQSDKYAYAREVQRLLRTRPNLDILEGTVEDFVLSETGRCTGVIFTPAPGATRPWREPGEGQLLGADCCAGEFSSGPESRDSEVAPTRLNAGAVVLTTGTFMRGLMHTGERKTQGGRVGEKAANTISTALQRLGLELGRLKTGTPPRLAADSIDLASLPLQPGDAQPTPFSEMTGVTGASGDAAYQQVASRFPVMPQIDCWVTQTTPAIHEAILGNLDRAPMYNGQIETQGPRYCPSIEDKVVRFRDRESHHVFLEPESLETDEIYCNGISTSLPQDVQDRIVRQLPGCEKAKILRYGYAVEYDMVWPHQIDATCMTKRIAGLFLAGQINGTSGYEEAAGQGLMAGVNAVRFGRGEELLRLRRDQAYIGVLMDDLVTKTPREPYRMFTSRAEHRLLLRADNADQRLTELGRAWGLVDDLRWEHFQAKQASMEALRQWMRATRHHGQTVEQWARRPDVDVAAISALPGAPAMTPRAMATVVADIQYAGYIDRHRREVEKLERQESLPLPADAAFDYQSLSGLRTEAALTLNHFRPATLGQAGRLAGVNPTDLMIVSLAMRR